MLACFFFDHHHFTKKRFWKIQSSSFNTKPRYQQTKQIQSKLVNITLSCLPNLQLKPQFFYPLHNISMKISGDPLIVLYSIHFLCNNFTCCSSQTEQFHRLYNFPMGNSSRSPEDYDLVCKFSRQDWINQSNQADLQIWRNKFTKEAVQVIRLYEIPSMEDMDIYSFRMMENDLIKVYHLSIDQRYDMCAINQPSLLLVEFIPVKLSNIRNFDREEALTILSGTFRGFHLLQIKFGPIIPNEELIGFNQQGKTKIWLNSKSYINSIEPQLSNTQQSILNLQVSQRVKRLLQIIEQKTKYVLLPPSIRQQICHPYTTYLSALKILQKFAYFEKLNLRKYLQLGFHKNINPISIHKRNTSNLTQLKNNSQICCQRNESSCYDSGVKQPVQLRRMYSLNSIHNKSNNSSVFTPVQFPLVQSLDRSPQPILIKHSAMSNHSSNIESVRQSSANFKHCHVINISTAEEKKNITVDQVNNIAKQKQKAMYQPQKAVSKLLNQQPVSQQSKQQPKEYQIIAQQLQKVQANEPYQKQQEQQSIQINRIQSQQQPSVQDKSLQKQQIPLKEPVSPTFVINYQIEHEFRSFAPSQQNLQCLTIQENKQKDKQIINNKNIQDIRLIAPPQLSNKYSIQERRLSIENNNKKIDFPNQLAINSVSILNYCTSVQSKLHMATNRDHSIIDNKKSIVFSQFNKYQDDQIQQYIREKYIVLQSKPQQKPIVSKPQRPVKIIQAANLIHPNISSVSSKPKKQNNTQVSTSLNRFDAEQDFLDVNFLQKSLDKRYCNIQNQLKMQQQKKEMQENDALNIAKLQQGLQKFSKSQLSNKNTDHNIQSKQLIQKKQFQYTGSFQHEKPYAVISTFNPLQHSTGFQSYHPFKEKHINEERFHNAHFNQQSFDYQNKIQKKMTNEERYSKKEYENNNFNPNKHQYSFEGNSKSSYSPHNSSKPINRSYYIKETQLSSFQQTKNNKYQDLYPQTNSFDAIQPKTTHRGISYEQLRQFLWN